MTNYIFLDNRGVAASTDLALNPIFTGVTVQNNAIDSLQVDGRALAKDGF